MIFFDAFAIGSGAQTMEIDAGCEKKSKRTFVGDKGLSDGKKYQHVIVTEMPLGLCAYTAPGRVNDYVGGYGENPSETLEVSDKIAKHASIRLNFAKRESTI